MYNTQEKLRAPADFDGPVKDRKCTDVLFTLLIVAMWVAMTIVGITSIQEGDVTKLIAPTNYEGSLCGYDSDYEDLPYLYYVNTQGSGICVESCPTETNTSVVLCRDDRDDSLSDEEAVAAGYCLSQFESVRVVNYCVFSDSDVWDQVEQSTLESYLIRFIADVVEARAYVFGFGFGVAIAISFLYIGLLQIPGLVATVVWSCVALVLAALLALGYGLWITAEQWNDAGTKSDVIVNTTYASAIIAWVFAFLWVCLFCFLAKRISLAIGIIKKAGRAIAAMPLIVLWPLVELVAAIAFMAVWTVYAAYTASLGEITTKTVVSSDEIDLSYKAYEFDQQTEYRGWFLIFCLFWTLNFITAFGQIVIAMSVSAWYFARSKVSVGSLIVFASATKTFCFHVGTASFGGLIIAIVEFVRAILSYINKKAKLSGNKIAEYISCCCICCMWCLENCLRFINKNAYVQTAIFSTNFCTSARNAFSLIARNLVRVAAVTVLGDFVLRVMTLFVTIVTTMGVYYAMEANIKKDLNSLVGPTIMAAVLAYFTGKMITAVYGMAITTILHCFVADEELFPPSQQFAENDLKGWVDRHGAPIEANANPGTERRSAERRSSAQNYSFS
ncbi:unnamed protein product [Ascophyllum nodosum]